MDFGSLLHIAQQKTQSNKNGFQYYKTKFEPPKKEERTSKNLSANIQKFLARKEAEEKVKAEEARIKKLELLALRSQDSKAKRRVQVMLKRTKSANKSVIDDAVDQTNTAVTLAGPSQPDEDDYGYESQEAAAYYAKMMERYGNMPEEEKFPQAKRKASTNLESTRDRVNAALLREQEEALLPHKRKRRTKLELERDAGGSATRTSRDDAPSGRSERAYEPEEAEIPEKKPKPKKAMPPPMDFNQLLKIAEKKQFEPIVIEPKKVDTDERPLTKKQRREYEKERAFLEAKEARQRAQKDRERDGKSDRGDGPRLTNGKVSKPGGSAAEETKTSKSDPPRSSSEKANATRPTGHVEKDEAKAQPSAKRQSDVRTSSLQRFPLQKPSPQKLPAQNPPSQRPPAQRPPAQRPPAQRPPAQRPPAQRPPAQRSPPQKSSPQRPQISQKPNLEQRPPLSTKKQESRPPFKKPEPVPSGSKKYDGLGKLGDRNGHVAGSLSGGKRPLSSVHVADESSRTVNAKADPKKNVPATKETKPRPNLLPDVKPKRFPPFDTAPRQFPPADVRRKPFPPRDLKRKKLVAKKGRIIDDDDSEYDSELDDFIDDGPEETEDYSKYISEIFGYDKSRYRDIDEGDDAAMESNYSNILKEEYISAKIGIMEDLEDMKQEQIEKKRKMMMKKQRR